MADEELKLVATTAFKTLITTRKLKTPVTSMELLTGVMTTKVPQGLLPHAKTPRFRLTDLTRFENIIEDLSNTWADGVIIFSRDNSTGVMMIWELSTSQPVGPNGQLLLGAGHSSLGGGSDLSGFNSRKRKRVIDEDADSAAGDDETLLEEDDPADASSSTLANLNAEMREVYTILQSSTTKGRLLAEQVSHFDSIDMCLADLTPHCYIPVSFQRR